MKAHPLLLAKEDSKSRLLLLTRAAVHTQGRGFFVIFLFYRTAAENAISFLKNVKKFFWKVWDSLDRISKMSIKSGRFQCTPAPRSQRLPQESMS